jgi:hypothetical protein
MLLVNEQGKPLLFPVVDDRTMQSYFEAAKVPLPFRPSSSQEVIDPESGEKKYSGRFRVLRWGPMADARCTISAQTYGKFEAGSIIKRNPPGCEPGGVSSLSHAGRGARAGILVRQCSIWSSPPGECLSESNRPPR